MWSENNAWGGPSLKYEDNIKADLEEIGFENVDWNSVALIGRDVNMVMKLRILYKGWNTLTSWATSGFQEGH
jgi:hypothetical protein